RVDEVVHLAGERLLGNRRGLMDIAGRQIQRLGGLLEPRTQQSTAHADGRLAGTFGQRSGRADRAVFGGGHAWITLASTAIRSPATPTRRGDRWRRAGLRSRPRCCTPE